MIWVYPRVCGGTHSLLDMNHELGGLSPRVRGNPSFSDSVLEVLGSIPACAGEPEKRLWSITITGVYPRVCGGTYLNQKLSYVRPGLSPRVRGNLSQKLSTIRREGSIPACAGEPCISHWYLTLSKVYPRVCGGTALANPRSTAASGLSPRVRGNRYSDRYEHL